MRACVCVRVERAWIGAQSRKVITGNLQKSNKADLVFIRLKYFESSDVPVNAGRVSELCLPKCVFISPGCTGMAKGTRARMAAGSWPHPGADVQGLGHMGRGNRFSGYNLPVGCQWGGF